MDETNSEAELEQRPYARVLNDFWESAEFYQEHYRQDEPAGDPYIVAFSKALLQMHASVKGADVDGFLANALDLRYHKPRHESPLSGDDLYNLLLRFVNRYAKVRIQQRHPYDQPTAEELAYPTDAFLRPVAYKDLLKWMMTNLHAREMLLWDFERRSVQTTLDSRYADVPLLAAELMGRGKHIILDIGTGDMSGMLKLAERTPFHRIQFNSRLKDGGTRPLNEETNRQLNRAVNRPLSFSLAYCIDRQDPLDKSNFDHIQSCRRPGEIARDGYVTAEEHRERVERQSRLVPYIGELTVNGIRNVYKRGQPEIADGTASIIIAKTVTRYFNRRLRKEFLRVFSELGRENSEAIVTDHMFFEDSMPRYYRSRGKYPYTTYLCRPGETPLEVLTYSDGRCQVATLGKDFHKLAIAEELDLAS